MSTSHKKFEIKTPVFSLFPTISSSRSTSLITSQIGVKGSSADSITSKAPMLTDTPNERPAALVTTTATPSLEIKTAASPLEKVDVVISGGGPTALAMALQALKRGKSVALVTDRTVDEFVRVQRVSLYPENRKYLLDMLRNEKGQLRELKLPVDQEDIKFVLELINAPGIGIKDIERFLKRRLDELKKPIQYIEHSQLTNIDIKKGIVETEAIAKRSKEQPAKERQFQFNSLVCADGPRHHAVNVLNKGLEKQKRIQYEERVNSTHAPYNVSAYVSIRRIDDNKLEVPDKRTIVNSAGLISILGLNKYSASYIKDGKVLKCFFTAAVSKRIFNLINQRNADSTSAAEKARIETEILDYLRGIIIPYFKNGNLNKGANLEVKLVKPSRKHGIDKDKLKLLALTIEATRASQAAIALGSGRLGLILGDSFHASNYLFGFGLNDGLLYSILAGEVLSGRKTLAEFDSECKSIASKWELTTRATNWSCLRRLFLGRGIEKAIDENLRKFQTQYSDLRNQLREQKDIQYYEQKMMSRPEKSELKEDHPLLSNTI